MATANFSTLRTIHENQSLRVATREPATLEVATQENRGPLLAADNRHMGGRNPSLVRHFAGPPAPC